MPSCKPFSTQFKKDMTAQNINSVESFLKEFELGCKEKHNACMLRDANEMEKLNIGCGYFPQLVNYDSKDSYKDFLLEDYNRSMEILRYGVFGEKSFYRYYTEFCKLSGEKFVFKLNVFKNNIKDVKIVRRNKASIGNGNYYITYI